MRIEDFLSRLQKVKKTGANNWMACCPAHHDNRPSMTLAVGNNGGILVHCFALCSVDEIAGAVGLTVSDLMPERPEGKEFVAGRSRPFPAADVLLAVEQECLTALVAAYNIANGIELDEKDRDRLLNAYHRIAEARRLALG
jgi:hypothetical protein